MFQPLFFAYDYCTPDGIFPNGVDIRYHSDPQYFGRYIEGRLQPAFLHFDFTQYTTNSAFVSTNWLDYNRHRKFIYPLTIYGGPDSWLGGKNAPSNHSSIFCKVSDKALIAQRDGRALFLINQLWEGFCPYTFNIFNRIQEDINRYDLKSENIVYASANLLIEEKHRLWKAANTIPHGKFVCKAVEFFGDLARVRSKQSEEIMSFKYEEPIFEKDYVCLNRRPHTHRLMLVTELFIRDLLDAGYVSCPPRELITTPPQQCFGIQNAKEKWEALIEHLPLVVDKENFMENHALDMTSWPYTKAWFSVITETLYSSREKTVFLSEKIFKPIQFFHPFIIVSQPYYLKKLRELGYCTFSPFINEKYDLIESDDDRLIAIVEEIKRLCDLSIEEKKKLSGKMKDIVIHNRNHMLNKLPAFKELNDMLTSFVMAET